jgi:hypothetical protein
MISLLDIKYRLAVLHEDAVDFLWKGKPLGAVIETHNRESEQYALHFRNAILEEYPDKPVVIRKGEIEGETECGVRVIIERGRALLRFWNRTNQPTVDWVDPYNLLDRFGEQ